MNPKLHFVIHTISALGSTPPDRPPVDFPNTFDLGYRGIFPRILFWWERNGDELASFDGQSMTCGLLDNYLFIEWLNSLPVETRQSLQIGDSETEAINGLLVDLRANTVELLPLHETFRKLRDEISQQNRLEELFWLSKSKTVPLTQHEIDQNEALKKWNGKHGEIRAATWSEYDPGEMI